MSHEPTQPTKRDNPGVIAPPPLIYAAGFLVGWLLNRILPLELPIWMQYVGLVLIAASLVPGPWALLLMLGAGTNPEPSHPTTALVTSGPFRYTRNPIYLTFTLFLVGVGLLTRNGWVIIAALLVLVVMHNGVILREERYLERKFGAEYVAYKQHVRRWL